MNKPNQTPRIAAFRQCLCGRWWEVYAALCPLAPLFIVTVVLVVFLSLATWVNPLLASSEVFRSSTPSNPWMYKWDSLARTLWSVSSIILVLGFVASIYIWQQVVEFFWTKLMWTYWFVMVLIFVVSGIAAWHICCKFIPQSGINSGDFVNSCWQLITVSEEILLGDAETFITIIGIVGMFFLISASYALLAASYNLEINVLADAGKRFEWLGYMLYIAAFLTIGAALNVRSLAWRQASLISKEADADAYVKFGSAFATSIGVSYTFIVTVVYGSVAMPLLKKAREHVQPKDANAEKVEAILRKHGITSSLSQQISHFAACIGPAMVGPIADLLG